MYIRQFTTYCKFTIGCKFTNDKGTLHWSHTEPLMPCSKASKATSNQI